MAALSLAQENAVSLWLAIILAALLALALAAVITYPPQTDSPPAEAGDAEPYLPKHASEPPTPALPRGSRSRHPRPSLADVRALAAEHGYDVIRRDRED